MHDFIFNFLFMRCWW